MVPLRHPLRFLLVALAGWINQQQRDVLDYLQEENRVLREQLRPRRLRFTNDLRIRLVAKAHPLGRGGMLATSGQTGGGRCRSSDPTLWCVGIGARSPPIGAGV